jgi:hypothetical protein
MLSAELECFLQCWNAFYRVGIPLYRVFYAFYRVGIPLYRGGMLSTGLECF